MVVEFTIITDIEKQLPNGKYLTLVKNARIVRSFESDRINYLQCVDRKGRVIKKYTNIIYNGEVFKVENTLDEVKRKLGHYEIAGYAGKASYAKKSNKNKRV